ncbi:MAG: zinc ribbon domain-containing protein [Nitrospirota bacterium]|nr:MAG: zinc ribbon domain-containing protein [Nitrospirota bacterium]
MNGLLLYNTNRLFRLYHDASGVRQTMSAFKICSSCSSQIPAHGRFCPRCGNRVDTLHKESKFSETLNIRILYVMVALLILALLFPPWETPPGDPPEFLGFHFILSPPSPGAVVSRILQTIQLVTIAVGGMYFSWLFRWKSQ